MFIESTFMKYGKGLHGINGVSLTPETVKVWALSLHTCALLEQDIQEMTDVKSYKEPKLFHEEELKGRILTLIIRII